MDVWSLQTLLNLIDAMTTPASDVDSSDTVLTRGSAVPRAGTSADRGVGAAPVTTASVMAASYRGVMNVTDDFFDPRASLPIPRAVGAVEASSDYWGTHSTVLTSNTVVTGGTWA